MTKLFKVYCNTKHMLVLLALLDILAGITLVFSWAGQVVSIIGLLVLVKGIYSLTTSFTSKYFFDWMGWVDLITGIMLIFGLFVPFFWVLPILKGVYSLLFSFK